MIEAENRRPRTEFRLEEQEWSVRVSGAITDIRIHLSKAETLFELGEYAEAAKCVERVIYMARILLKAAREAAGGRDGGRS